jgi:hypothetical protein
VLYKVLALTPEEIDASETTEETKQVGETKVAEATNKKPIKVDNKKIQLICESMVKDIVKESKGEFEMTESLSRLIKQSTFKLLKFLNF